MWCVGKGVCSGGNVVCVVAGVVCGGVVVACRYGSGGRAVWWVCVAGSVWAVQGGQAGRRWHSGQ